MSEYALQRRDTYITTVLQRLTYLTQHWRLSDGGEALLRQLGKLFDAPGHAFQSLPSETTHDFPRWLCALNASLLSRITETDPDDDETAFQRFLRLLATFASEHSTSESAAVRRVFYRLLPVRQVKFSAAHPPTRAELSQLVNAYALALLALYLVPSSDAREVRAQLRRVQGWLDFGTADHNSQLVCIRAVQYFGIVCQHHHLQLDDVADWFAALVDQLQLALSSPAHTSSTSMLTSNSRPAHVQLLLQAALRAWRNVCSHPSLVPDQPVEDEALPSAVLLRPSKCISLRESGVRGTRLTWQQTSF